MKKYLFLFALGVILLASGMVNAQTKYVWAKGAKGVDSISGATSKYYTMTPNSSYGQTAIQVYVTRSVITGTDSTHIWFEGSIDGSVWYKIDVGTPITGGGATYISGGAAAGKLSVQANGGALYAGPLEWSFPYTRMAVQHFKAACNVYVKGWTYFKKP